MSGLSSGWKHEKKALRILAVFVLLLAGGILGGQSYAQSWLDQNQHRQREVPDPAQPELTGIQYDKGFVPGAGFFWRPPPPGVGSDGGNRYSIFSQKYKCRELDCQNYEISIHCRIACPRWHYPS